MTRHRARWVAGLVVLVLVTTGLSLSRAAALAAQATPATTGAASGPLGELLSLVPIAWDEPAIETDPPLKFVDLAAQLAAVGLQPPASTQDAGGMDAFMAATNAVTAPGLLQIAFQYHERWSELFGFDAIQVDQALEYGNPPVRLLIVRGRFDPARMRAAWANTGFRELDPIDGASVASLVPEGGQHRDLDASRLSGGAAHNAAILPDGTVIFAHSLAGLQRILDTAAGRAPSIADRPEVATLLAGVDVPLAGAIIIVGADLQLQPPGIGVYNLPASGAGAAHSGQLPPIRMALLGITPGGPVRLGSDTGATPVALPAGQARGQMLFAALFDDLPSATAALPIIDDRLATDSSAVAQRPYRALLAGWSLRLAASAPVVLIDVPLGDRFQGVWQQMYETGDLGFLAW